MSEHDAQPTANELERLRAAESVCWWIITLMHFGCSADEILHSVDDLQTWANLAARDGVLRDDDPEGKVVTHAVPWPSGEILARYER